MILLFILNFTLPGVSTRGDVLFYYDARSLGLGGNTTVLENNLNPASTCLNDRAQLNLGGLLFRGMEKRGLRVYDSYGNNIGISTISTNQINNLDFAPVSFIIPIKILRAGVKHYKFYDFGYYFSHTYRDYYYQVIKTVDNSYTGALNGIAPVIGLNYKFVNFGFESDIIYGSTKKELKTFYPAGEDSVKSISHNFSGNTFKFGCIFSPSVHFRLGYLYENNFEVIDGDVTLSYPVAHNIGIYYQPPHRIPTKFVAELNYELWDDPIFCYKFGIEHTILYAYSLRYGFCLLPDYNQNAIWTTIFTLGLGANFKNYYFDFGFAFGKRDYANTDFGGLGIEEKYIFDETQNHFILSFGFKL